ncbi:MAG: clostripain-related cysteine peptidase [Candidatus Hodarchaeota archaeon]
MKGAHQLFLLLFSLLLFVAPPEIPFPQKISTPVWQDPIPVTNPTEVLDFITLMKNPLQGSTARKWTILIYMAADSGSETAAIADIKEMEQIGGNNQINILVYVDFESNTTGVNLGASTYNITQNGDPEGNAILSPPLITPLASYPNMGDPLTLLNFIVFGQHYSVADHYLLILWGLGAGYEGVCYDEGNDDWLLPFEITTVFENSTVEPIDIVAFDASFMGQLEVVYELRDSTNLLLSSETTIPKEHFPYQAFLYSLSLYPDSPPQALAVEIGFRYIEAYSFGGTYYGNYLIPPTNLCISVVNTTRLVGVMTWFTRLLNTLLTSNTLLEQYSAISGARGNTLQFALPQVIDLGAFGYQIAQQLPLLVTGSLGYNLTLDILNAVIYERHMSDATGASGLSVFLAEHGLASLSLLNDTHFEEFIQAFHAIGETPASGPIFPQSGQINGYLDGANDSVYFRWIAQASVVHTLQLTAYQTGDEDFDLYLYDANMNLLDQSVDISSTEIIQYAVIQGQTYYIRVHSYPSKDVTFGIGACRLTLTPSTGINPIIFVLLAATIIGIAILVVFLYLVLRRVWLYVLSQRQRRRTTQEQIAENPSALSKESINQMDCSECGEAYPPGARFCPNCGGNTTNHRKPDNNPLNPVD